MDMSHVPYGKKLLSLPIVLLLALSILSILDVNIAEVSALEYPSIYIEPAFIMDPMLTPGTNFTISIKTDYNGTDIRVWTFTLSYNPNVLHGGIQRTDMWTGDGVTKTFNMTGTPVVPGSEVIRVNGTLMTRKTKGTDTWIGDNVTRIFNMTGTPVVPGSEVIRVNGTLMTRKTKGTDTWIGDGVTKKFYTTQKPIIDEPLPEEEVRVYVDEKPMHINTEYTVNYAEGIIEFRDTAIPANGSEIKVEYHYGHYYVVYSEGMIKFYTLATPPAGVEIEATYQYKQYAVDYSEDSITFSTTPSEGAKVEVTYLYDGVANGDLITKEKHSSATFNPGTFNNTAGSLSETYAHFFYINPPIPVTSGPGTLANITFTVVGKGTSDITLEKAALGGAHDGDTYTIIDDTMPEHIGHGYFSNLPSIYVDPATTVDPNLTSGMNFTVSILTDYYNETEDVWGWEFSLTYNSSVLQGIEVTNGDLITTDKDPSATFNPGTFDNEAGKLSLTKANFSYTGTPLPVTSGPGTLATVTFRVVGTGDSNITLGPETRLIGVNASTGEEYNIIDSTMPNQIRHGFFSNALHDIAVTNVTAFPDMVRIGESVSINVTVTNEGSFTETFNVTVYYGNITIGTQMVTDLAALNEITVIFTWDTTGMTPDSYTITAEATLASDDDITDNTFTDGTVKIVKLPVASFTYSPENPVANQMVTFNASLSTPNGGSITSYAWDFGDGNTTTTADPIMTHVYAVPGTYNVTLTITDSEGLTDTATDTVTVNEAPPGIPWYFYVAAAGAAAIIIAAIAFYLLKIRKST